MRNVVNEGKKSLREAYWHYYYCNDVNRWTKKSKATARKIKASSLLGAEIRKLKKQQKKMKWSWNKILAKTFSRNLIKVKKYFKRAPIYSKSCKHEIRFWNMSVQLLTCDMERERFLSTRLSGRNFHITNFHWFLSNSFWKFLHFSSFFSFKNLWKYFELFKKNIKLFYYFREGSVKQCSCRILIFITQHKILNFRLNSLSHLIKN